MIPFASLLLAAGALAQDPAPWLHYPGDAEQAPGHNRRVVLLAGDEEYRSEEVQPLLARQLNRLGFECYVLFSQDPETGEVDPNNVHHFPGTQHLADAALLIVQLRFREFDDATMQPIVDFVEAGKPVIGIRTATHAFNYRQNLDSPYAHWSYRSKKWDGGFGRQILGETWITHHGNHGQQATRALPAPRQAHHPVMRGVGPCFGPTDVYGVRNLPEDCVVLMHGQVVIGMSPDDPLVEGKQNEPMMPVSWVRERELGEGRKQRVFTTTMGDAQDFSDPDLRRLLLNASLWCLGDEAAIPEHGFEASLSEVWQPTAFGFGSARTGYKPEDYRLGSPWTIRSESADE